jgi:glyoxylase-like metal-dependent hydrolase (beta-lactamase superfamily II)
VKVLQLEVGNMKNYTYIIHDETMLGAVIDPGWEPEKIVSEAARLKIRVRYIINTHSHFDHVTGNQAVKDATGGEIVGHAASPVPKDISVSDGDTMSLGTLTVKFIHTPGHTPDSICIHVSGCLFTGDTLFVGECGRVDLPGGDAGALYDSLFTKILALEGSTVIYPGHDYGVTPTSTVQKERETNYVLQPRTREEFIRFTHAP